MSRSPILSVSQLEPILQKHRALDITLRIAETSESQDGSEDPPLPDPSAEDKFSDCVQQIRDIFARQWRNMRSYRRAETPLPNRPATIFSVEYRCGMAGSTDVLQQFSAYVEDEEPVGVPDAAPALYIAADRIGVAANQATTIWWQMIGSDDVPLL
jgi:glycine cleavage system regulatory protein